MRRILIIDDDLDMCQLLSQFLQRKGFETETAHTGHKGLEKFNESKFDLVLCDFRLGDMDGRKVLQKIKSIKFRKARRGNTLLLIRRKYF